MLLYISFYSTLDEETLFEYFLTQRSMDSIHSSLKEKFVSVISQSVCVKNNVINLFQKYYNLLLDEWFRKYSKVPREGWHLTN